MKIHKIKTGEIKKSGNEAKFSINMSRRWQPGKIVDHNTRTSKSVSKVGISDLTRKTGLRVVEAKRYLCNERRPGTKKGIQESS